MERSSRRTQRKDEESRLERVNDDISLDELDKKLRSTVDLSEMYEPLKECLDAIDLPKIVLGLVEKKAVLIPLNARKHSFDEMMMERN